MEFLMFSLIQFELLEGFVEWIMKSIEKHGGSGVSLRVVH
jgi:hypothetical protein